MFAIDYQVIPFFETICSVDQGTEINPQVEAVLRIVKNAMACREAKMNGELQPHFEIESNAELAALNGIQINTGMCSPEMCLVQGYDLHSYSFDYTGAETAIDYLAKKWHTYWYYAMQELGRWDEVIGKTQARKNRKSRKH